MYCTTFGYFSFPYQLLKVEYIEYRFAVCISGNQTSQETHPSDLTRAIKTRVIIQRAALSSNRQHKLSVYMFLSSLLSNQTS